MTPRQKAAQRAEEIEKLLTEDSLPIGKRKALEREITNIGDNMAEGCYSNDPDDGIDWSDCPGISSGRLPEPEYLTFYCPEMTYKLHYVNDEGDATYDDYIPSDIIEPYRDRIAEVMEQEPPIVFEHPRVLDVTSGVELHEGKLFGTLTVSIYGNLSVEDIKSLHQPLTDVANSINTGFTNRKIETDGGDLVIDFCSGLEPLRTETAFYNMMYVKQNESVFGLIKFYADADSDCLRMIYYNPDSDAGGQIVQNDLSIDMLKEAAAECETDEQFWNRLDERARQYLTDIDSPDFEDEAHHFVNEPYDFAGQDGSTAEKIKDWIGQKCVESQGMSLQ